MSQSRRLKLSTMMRALKDPFAIANAAAVEKFVAELELKEASLTAWNAVIAPTAQELALKEARLAALNSEVDTLRQQHSTLRGDDARAAIAPQGIMLPQRLGKLRLQEDRVINQLLAMGFDPLASKGRKGSRTPGPKSAVWAVLKAERGLFPSAKSFEKTWARLIRFELVSNEAAQVAPAKTSPQKG